MKIIRVRVSEQVLVERINWKLGPRGRSLKVIQRPGFFYADVNYYVMDNATQKVERRKLDLEQYGRRIGVLQPHERLAG